MNDLPDAHTNTYFAIASHSKYGIFRTEAFGNLPKNLPSSKCAASDKSASVKPEQPSSSEDSDKENERSYHSASSVKESDGEIEIMDATAIRDAIRNATDAAVNDAAIAAANAAIANLGPSGGDSALSPSKFYGKPKEDAITWLQQVEAWCAYKNFNSDRLTRLSIAIERTSVFMVQIARKWR